MAARSLSFRLIVSEALVLIVFYTLVTLILEQSFRENAEQALQERLQTHIYALLSSVDFDNSGHVKKSPNLQDPRFINPGSGLYAFIYQQKPEKKQLWSSPSVANGVEINTPNLKVNQWAFLLENKKRYALHYDVIWKNIAGIKREYVFTVAEDTQFVNDQVQHYGETLRFWLLARLLVLVFIQFALLRWSLKPLRTIAKDLDAVEQGEKTHLDGQYPTELQGLVGNLNVFINHERAHLERYRNTLADLAHSLKTPLAILQGCTESFSDNKDTVQEQILRMNKIIEYQLQRAAAKGEQNAIKSVDLSEIIRKIHQSLTKVYIDRGIVFDLVIPEQCQIYCEEGDVYEIVGNLMDNACKWCDSAVKVSILLDQRKARRNFSVMLQIEDDGPGIPVGKFNDILKRGVRADENIHGHGIGVSVVAELIGLLGGKLEGGESETLKGMRWGVYLP
ncbi:ATP-binding protein [Crenothrix polyspora]|uniref:histidine kinase n=1 Tax=Crenothrix polyspora TaxID=360316 RepID=A0A1R4HJW0_9GAMM|nr:ATP-binding protein [Crenothrix polyspora]SJM96493.1 Integral membrane sensor signal transduction histidine kinase [Crenothrix polyspora]